MFGKCGIKTKKKLETLVVGGIKKLGRQKAD